MGANILLVQPGTAASGGVSFGAGSVMTLTPQDCDAILRECPAVESAAPIVRARSQVVYADRNWIPFYIYGTTPAFLEVRNWTDLVAGEPFSDKDVRDGNKVCLLGQTLVHELFQDEPPVGKEIRVQNVGMRVVGVLSRKGANMVGLDQDDILIAPWTTVRFRIAGSSLANATSGQTQEGANSTTSAAPASSNRIYPTDAVALYPAPSASEVMDTPIPTRFTNVDQILVGSRGASEIKQAQREITELLHVRHRIRPGELDDFNVRDMTEMTNAVSSTSTLMTKLLLVVAVISLVVGGVGIMNIMLVSVTERTREIGLRMAVGARGRDILRQFLIEAVVLCLAGGAIGILFGRLTSYFVTLVLHWPTQSSVPAIAAAVLVATVVGVIFGFYPAWKASRLKPIEALRYE